MADMYIIHQPEKILCDLKRSFSFSNLSRSYTDKFFFKKKKTKKAQYSTVHTYILPDPSSQFLTTTYSTVRIHTHSTAVAVAVGCRAAAGRKTSSSSAGSAGSAAVESRCT